PRRQVPRGRRAPAGADPDAADQDVHRRRPARRRADDRRRHRAAAAVRQPAAGLAGRLIGPRENHDRYRHPPAASPPAPGARAMLPNLTLVIQGIAFFAVAWLVMKFGWPHILGAIEERQQKIAEGLAAADRSQKDLAQAQDKANEALREARAKANEVIEQAHQRANQIDEAAKNDASAEAGRQKALAEAEIAAAANRAREDLRKQVSLLAVSGAEKLLRREIDASAHKALLDELAAQLADKAA